MKSYTITVNGNVYDVTVEENGAATPAAAAAPRKAAFGGYRLLLVPRAFVCTRGCRNKKVCEENSDNCVQAAVRCETYRLRC